MDTYYKVSVENSLGSDELVFSKYETAVKEAKQWKRELQEEGKQRTIAVVKITEELVAEI